MKRKFRICALLLSFLLVILMVPASAAPSNYDYYIKDYDVQATYRSNNQVEVEETVTVDFQEPHHGIYRYLDTEVYVNRDVSKEVDGSEYKLMEYHADMEHIDTGDDPFEVESDGSLRQIIIGSEHKKITGLHTYHISYTMVIPDDRVDTTDFLMYSLLGSQWEVPIEHLTFNVAFEKPLTDDALGMFKVYSGDYGVESNALKVKYDLSKNRIRGSVDNVNPGQSVTIFTNLEEGYFQNEKTSNTPVLSQGGGITGIVAALGAMLYGFFKPKKKVVPTVEFYPPEGISSAEVGTIIDDTVDDIDIMSLIPWFAEQGYLRIEQLPDKKGRYGKHADLVLHKENPLPEDAPQYQRTFFNALFKEGTTCHLKDLSDDFGEHFLEAKDNLNGVFTGEKKLSKGKEKGLFLTLLLGALSLGALTATSPLGPSENVVFAAFAVAPAVLFALYRLGTAAKDVTRSKKSWFKMALCALGLMCSSAGGVYCIANEEHYLSVVVLALIPAALWLFALCSGKLVEATEYKVQTAGKLFGLKQFIETAEQDRLKALAEENPEYFYNVLPYAMVFGLSELWAKQFKNIPTQPPAWYHSDYDTVFDTYYLYSVLNVNMTRSMQDVVNAQKIEAAKSTAEGVTGFGGGGGFSGGGFGGGGGGAW